MVDRIGAIIDKYPRTAQTPEQHQKDLEDMMAELSGKLPGAMKTFGAGQTPPRRQTQYLNQYQAGQVGIPLPKDWQLKLLPVDDLNGMPHYSYVMPDGWEATDYGTFVDPTGKRYTAEQYNALEPWNVPYQREKLVARLSFSDEMPVTERMRVETEQTMFLETVSTYERTSELEDLLKELFNIDDAQVDQLFVKDPLRVDPSAQWPGGYEQKQYYDYIEQTEALTNEPSLSKAITNPSRLPPEEYSLMGFDPGSVWDVTKNIGSVLGAMFEGLFSNVTVGPQYSDTQGPGSEEFTSLPRWISPLGLNIRKSFATYFTGSIGDLARDIAFHAEVKGYDGIASGLRGMVKGFDFQSPPDPGIEERGWELYANPRYYQTQFAQPLAFSMALMPFTLLGPGVALGVGAGTVGTLIITTLFTIAGANVIESSTEAGGAARQAQAMGMSRAEQERVADEVFKGNMIALGASNPGQILFGLATKLPFIGNNPFLRLGFKVAGEAIWEAGEEATQDVLTRTALGQKVEFDYQMQENLIAGGMMGGGTGVIFDALGRLQSRAINNLPEAQFKTFQNLVEQFKKEGWTESTAILKALDDIAKTPEGATAVRAAVIETQMDEARRQLDMMGSDDFVVPSSKSIIDSEFAQSWYKRMERKIAKAPFMKKTIETLFGTRELTELESQVTKDIVGRSAILYHMIQKMGKELATAEAHILHGRFIDSAKAFGFNKVGFSQQMQDSLADVYSEHKDIAGTVEHVFTHKEMYHLSEAQSEYIDKVLHIFHRLLAQAKREGTAPKNLVVGEYIHRVVTGKIVDGELVPIRGAEGRGGKALGAKDKSRVYKTMAEGIADNTAYSPNIEDSIRTAIQNDYKKIADKRLADALSEYGDTPLALLMEKYPELEKRYQETKGERDRANKLKAAVNIAAHGGVFQASQLRALRRQFPYITERLMDLTRQRQDNAELLNSEVKRLTKAVERLRDYNARVVEGKERSIKKLNNELIGLIEKQKITEASMKEAFNLLDFKSRGTMSDVLLSQIQSLETQRENLKSELAEANVEDSKLINSSIKKIDVLIKQAQKYSEWLSEEMWSSTKQYYDSVEHHQESQVKTKEQHEIEEPKANIQSQEIPVPKVVSLNVSEITVDAERFQFKTGTGKGGATNLLRGLKWDITKADVILVWKDPIDGNTYVINGHHRLGLAQETGQKTIDARYIPASNAKVARAVGAEANIAQGRGTAIDAAKLFRELGVDAAYLENSGLSAREKMVADGMALANLDNNLFAAVIRGDMPVARGVTIGRELPNHAQQVALVKLLEKKKRMSEAEVAELIIFVRQSETTTSTQQTLFGEEMITKSLAIEKAQLSTYIKSRLSRDRKLFGYISQETRAARISELGVGEIDTGVSKDIASDAAIVEEVFTKRVIYAGEIADALNAAASELAQGGKESDIKERLYKTIRAAVQVIIGQGEAGVRPDTIDVGTPAAQVTPDIQDVFTPAPVAPEVQAEVTEEAEVKSEIPTQEAPTQIPGEMEAGLQKDIFGFWTEVRPKGKGKITQISMDEYNLLMKQWKENGHEGTPPNIGYAPDMTGEKSTEYFINEDMSDFDLQSPQKTEKEIKTELNLLQKEVENLKNKKKIDYEKARIKRKERLDRIKQGGMKLVTLPDGIEGNKGYIMQPMFGGKLYNQDFIDSINQFFGHEKGSSSLQFFADAAGILRLTKAAFDNSAPLIQGFPAHGFAFSKMITDPKTGYHLMGQWFKSIAISTGSFLDMGFAGRYVEANESVILEMVKNGSSLQAVDYFQTLGEQKGLGGLANKFLSALPLAPFQRAETAFFIAAQVSRTETYKAMHDKAKKNGQLRELARFVDRMTGIIDTSAMSVPQKMRQFEQAFMWFAPRYTRATASVVADVFRGGMTGSMARESLGGMISALALYTTAFTCFQGFLGNEDEDDINRRIMQNFGIDKDSITGETVWDPSAKLMSFKIGNRYFGVGGAYYSLVRLFGNIMECINEVGDREIIDLARIIKYGSLNRDNPFISWWYSRSSPLIGFFRDALYPLAKSVVKGELQTGSTYFGTPIETPAEYGYYIASKFMPIWIEQGIMPFAGNYLEKWLPNMSQEFEKPTGLAAVLTPFAEFFGFRGFVEGEWTIFYDEAQLIINDLPKEWLSLYYTEEELVLVLQAQERGELSFKQLPKQAQQDLLNDNDDLKLLREYATEASAIQRSEEWRNYFAEREEEMDYRNTGIYNAGERLRKGEINDFEYREILEIVFAVYNKGIEELETNPNYSNVRDFWERLDERESKYDWSLDRALNEYEAIIYDESLNDPVTGDYNYEELDRRKGLWIEKWGMVKYENILTYIGNNKAAQDYPEMFLTRRKDLEILGREYWDLPTKPLYEMTEDDLIEGKVPHEHELLVRILLTKTEEDAYESFIKGHPELTKDYKAEYRAEHPEEDAMLKLWGYGGDLQTMEAYDITMKRAKELEFTEERLLVMKLPPRVYAEKDFGYKDVTREFSGNSAEAKLYRIDHSAWANNWANEAYNWKELDVNENVLRIDVNFREQDNEYAALLNSEDEQAYLDTNEEYWTARLVRDAYKNDVEVKYHEKYIKYKKMPVKGKAQERFLRDNPDYYKDVWLNEDVLGNQPVNFDNIPSIEYDKLYADNKVKFDEYDAITDRGDREDYLYNDHDFAVIKYKADAYEKMIPEKDVATYANYMVIPPKAKDEWFINNQKYYNYVSYYEEEWYMIAHPEYHDEVYVTLQGNQPMDFTDVPTREVDKLYKGYLTEKKGSARLDYRALYPDLDKWMLLTKKVSKLVGDRGIPQYSTGPWADAERAKEIIDEYF